MKIALTGAAGHLGAAILQELAKRNIPVKALFRNNDLRSIEGLSVEVVKGDLMDRDILETLMLDCDTIIHCAAIISINGDPTGIVHRTNVEGTRLVIDQALKSGIKRFIHISSIHAYQQQPAFETLDEQRSVVTQNSFAYDRSKLAGQQVALAANGHGMEVIVVNPTSIIGPYDFKPSRMGRVIIDLYKGRLPFIFNGGFDFCDCRDVAAATVNAINMGIAGQSYMLGGKWYHLEQLISFISKASGKKINTVSLPRPVGSMGLPIVKLIGYIQNKEPLYTNEALEALFNGNRYISSAKAMTELNYTIRPLEETIYDTFHWFKNKGYLG